MSIYLCFTLYDYKREFFFLFIRRGFEISPSWNSTRVAFEKKLNENKKEPKESWNFESDFGQFRVKYDKKNKCNFVLLSNQKSKVDEQLSLMDKLYSFITEIKDYAKIHKDEIEKNYKQQVLQIIDEAERAYIQQYGQIDQAKAFQQQLKDIEQQIPIPVKSQIQGRKPQFGSAGPSQINSQSHIESMNSLPVTDNFLKPFRCFLMIDYSRQFFFMFIRIGFQLDKAWSQQRIKLCEIIMENEKNPPEILKFDGEFGHFLCKFDKKFKCYFILLSRYGVEEIKQEETLNEIYDTVLAIPKYTSIRYDDLEHKKKSQIERIIEKHSQSYIESHPAEFMSVQRLERRLQKLNDKEIQKQIEKEKEQSQIFKRKSFIKPSPQGTVIKSINKSNLEIILEQELNLQDYYEPGEISQKIKQYQSKELSFKKRIYHSDEKIN